MEQIEITKSEENKTGKKRFYYTFTDEPKSASELLRQFKKERNIPENMLDYSMSYLFQLVRTSSLFTGNLSSEEQLLLVQFIGWYHFYDVHERIRRMVEDWAKYMYLIEKKAIPTIFKYTKQLKRLAVLMGDPVAILYPYRVVEFLAEKQATGQITLRQANDMGIPYKGFLQYLVKRGEKYIDTFKFYNISFASLGEKLAEVKEYIVKISRELSVAYRFDFAKNVADMMLSDQEVLEFAGLLMDYMLKESKAVLTHLPKWIRRNIPRIKYYNAPPAYNLKHIGALRYSIMAFIALATGRRISEILALKWKDVELKEYDGKQRPFIDVNSTTGNEYFVFTFRVEKKGVSVTHTVDTKILPKYVNNAIYVGLQSLKAVSLAYIKALKPEASKKEIQDSYVFFKLSGKKPYGPWAGPPGSDRVRMQVYRILRRYITTLGKDASKFKFHSFRHIFISALMSKTSDMVFTARYANISLQTLLSYAHKSEEEVKRIQLFAPGVVDFGSESVKEVLHSTQKSPKNIIIEEIEEGEDEF